MEVGSILTGGNKLRELKIDPDDFHGDWNYVIVARGTTLLGRLSDSRALS